MHSNSVYDVITSQTEILLKNWKNSIQTNMLMPQMSKVSFGWKDFFSKNLEKINRTILQQSTLMAQIIQQIKITKI